MCRGQLWRPVSPLLEVVQSRNAPRWIPQVLSFPTRGVATLYDAPSQSYGQKTGKNPVSGKTGKIPGKRFLCFRTPKRSPICMPSFSSIGPPIVFGGGVLKNVTTWAQIDHPLLLCNWHMLSTNQASETLNSRQEKSFVSKPKSGFWFLVFDFQISVY